MNNVEEGRSPDPSGQTVLRILVVEDDACTALVFKSLLQKASYSVVHCSDGQAAVEAFAREKFDAVVLDLMMPRMDGIQVLKSIRAATVNPLVPVIIITAARLKLLEDEASRFGVKLYLDKTQTNELVEGLRKVLSEQSAASAAALRMAPLAPLQQSAGKFAGGDAASAKRNRFFSF